MTGKRTDGQIIIFSYGEAVQFLIPVNPFPFRRMIFLEE